MEKRNIIVSHFSVLLFSAETWLCPAKNFFGRERDEQRIEGCA